MALVGHRGCGPRFGTGMRVPGSAEGCSLRFGTGMRSVVPSSAAPPAEGTSRQGSACLSSPGSANAPAACALEVNPKQAKSLSIGKERPQRSGGSAWERGFPPARSSSAGQNHHVTPCQFPCLFGFSAVCVYVNPVIFFRCACVRFLLGGQLWSRT